MTRTRRLTGTLGLAGAAFLAASSALANGYQDLHQSAEGLSTAYATNAAGGTDISAMFSNPAALTRFQGSWLSAGTSLILPRDTFQGLQGTAGGGSTPLTGSPTVPSQFLDTTVGAAAYYSRQLTPNLFFGLGFNAPWATRSNYPTTAISRYVATNTDLTAYNVGPVLAYRLTDRLSIGGGPNFQVYTADFSTQVDTTRGLAAAPATDLTSRVHGDSFRVGFNVGLQYDLPGGARFGASYRSVIDHGFNAQSTLSSSSPALLSAVVGGLGLTGPDGGARFKIATPSILTLGVQAPITRDFTLYASGQRIGWSAFRSTVVTYANGFPTTVVDNNWNDTWYLAGGFGYRVTPKLTARAGIAYDWSPTPLAVRNPRAPNGDRVYVGTGVSYQKSADLKLNLSYAHCFFSDAPIALQGGDNLPRGTLFGVIKIDADILMAQATINLDRLHF